MDSALLTWYASFFFFTRHKVCGDSEASKKGARVKVCVKGHGQKRGAGGSELEATMHTHKRSSRATAAAAAAAVRL